jgi:hypothetical protein
MYRIAGILFCFALLSVSVQYGQIPAATTLAITNVTVVDVEKGGRLTDQTVIVTGNRISAVEPSAQVTAPAGARTIDGRGKFLTPGFWDMHVHSLEHLGIDYSYGMEPFKLYVANGITGVRDMGSSYIQLVTGKRRIEAGQLVAPRIIASGPLLEAGQPALNRAIISKYVPTPQAGRLAVDALAEAGVDLLKIHSGLTRETYLAIADQAKRRNVVFAGHVPEDVTAVEASNLGQRSIEHLAPLIPVCADPKSLRAVENNPNQTIQITREKCEETLLQLARNGTWLTPTLISTFPQTASNSPDVADQRRYLKPERRATCAPLPANERPGARARYELSQRITKMAADAGVRMLPGTDTTTCRVPGFAGVHEIILLVEAGLTPEQALRIGSYEPAVYLNQPDSLGTITRGKLADLVLLDADPLVDIRNIRRVAAVIANGRLFDSASRQKLFDDVLASAAGSD